MENKEIFYPVSIASFRKIREDGFLYVDKTAYIHKLIQSKESYFFLARPRRFGKSLLVSTLQEYFHGCRHLFHGLAIDRLQPEEWESFPVLRFDLSGNPYLNPEDLDHSLSTLLDNYERDYGICDKAYNVSNRFEKLIRTACEKSGKPVVILIDEYDSPLTSVLDNPELHDLFRQQLYAFYSMLKKSEPYIKFCFMTGVTRYGKLSVFSGLNNMEDISFLDDYAGICGVTEDELHTFYDPGVALFAKAKGITIHDVYQQLKFYYDGYHFTESLLDVYNPFSLNRALKYQKISDYWSESGTPSLFLKMLLRMDYNLEQLQGIMVTQSELTDLDAYTTDPVSLFFQAGYLTLKTYSDEDKVFTLGYPNREVESGILRNILKVYNPRDNAVSRTLVDMKKNLLMGKPDEFVNCLKIYFANIPVSLKKRVARYENYYHTVVYCLLTLLGLETRAEYGTASGYIDLIVKTDRFIYIIELKLNGTAEDAMEQIERKGYCEPFLLDSRPKIRIAIGFSKEAQNITDFIID